MFQNKIGNRMQFLLKRSVKHENRQKLGLDK